MYEDWIISIYNEYLKRYNITREKITWKQVFKKLASKKNRKVVIWYGLYILCSIVTMTSYAFGINKIIPEILLMIFTVIFIWTIFPIIYANEIPLIKYEERINIIKDIMKEHKLFKEDIIKELIRETGSIPEKIGLKSDLLGKTYLIITTLGAIKGMFNIDISNKQLISVIIIGIFIIILLGILIFVIVNLMLIFLKNSRIQRRKDFHEFLKILLLYKIGESDQ